jgi:hypothetical protein
MNRQSQWLFEAPITSESDRYNLYTNLEDLSDFENFKQRKPPTKQPPKLPADRLVEIYVYWKLQVPFRKDFKAFRQEVIMAIGRHVAKSEKAKIDGLLRSSFPEKMLKTNHKYYSDAPTAESAFVIIKATLRFTKKDHTGLDWLSIDT